MKEREREWTVKKREMSLYFLFSQKMVEAFGRKAAKERPKTLKVVRKIDEMRQRQDCVFQNAWFWCVFSQYQCSIHCVISSSPKNSYKNATGRGIGRVNTYSTSSNVFLRYFRLFNTLSNNYDLINYLKLFNCLDLNYV